MRTVIFKSCFKDDMQSFMEYRVATFAWNTYRLDNYRLSSFDRYLTIDLINYQNTDLLACL